MGRRDDADVGTDRRAAADRRILARLQNAQQARLGLDRHVADLVEEKRAALRLLEAADRARRRAGEGAFLVAKEFALDQLARDRRHVDGDEGSGPPLAEIVQCARHQLFAGAAFASDHDGEIGAHETSENAIDVLHRRRTANQRQLLFCADIFGGGQRGSYRRRKRALDDIDQLTQIEGLRQIFERATLGRFDRRHQSILRAHHDDAQLWADALDARDEIEAVLVWHDDIGDDKIALAVRHPPPQRRGIAGGANIISKACERLVEHGADGAVVVGDQDR